MLAARLVISTVSLLISCGDHATSSDQTSAESAPEELVAPNLTCRGLFGTPNDQSGADSTRCSLSCACDQGSHIFSQPRVESDVFSYTHANPISPLDADPYQQTERLDDPPEAQVCIVERDDASRRYTLKTQTLSDASSEEVTHLITHLGACGACSSLQDLSVYASRTDLTDPVRRCGLQGITQGMETNVACLKELGFTESCAVIWYYNTLNTRTACLDVCLAQLNEPYLTEAGELNECLACDERESGPIFKRYSGRTRRNSGLASAICRPCDSIARLTHSYLEERSE